MLLPGVPLDQTSAEEWWGKDAGLPHPRVHRKENGYSHNPRPHTSHPLSPAAHASQQTNNHRRNPTKSREIPECPTMHQAGGEHKSITPHPTGPPGSIHPHSWPAGGTTSQKLIRDASNEAAKIFWLDLIYFAASRQMAAPHNPGREK